MKIKRRVDNLKEDQLHLKPICDIELLRAWNGRAQAVIVTVKVQGRPGAFKREWAITSGRLDNSQVEDIQWWIFELVNDALLMSLMSHPSVPS